MSMRKQEWKEMNEMFNKAVSINPDGKALGRPVRKLPKIIERCTGQKIITKLSEV